MNTPDLELKKAIEDIALIKRAMSESKSRKPTESWSEITSNTNILILLSSFVIAGILLGFELIQNRIFTADILFSKGDPGFQSLIIFQTGLILATLLLGLYFVVFKASKSSLQAFSEYMVHNFRYLSHFTLLTDLLIKFSMFSLLILANKPEWIFPLFFLFIGDYCFQGRLFIFPIRTSIIIGLLNFGLGFTLFTMHSWSLIWPLVGFLITSGYSLIYIFPSAKISKDSQ